jgi:hypothetical protein
LLSKTYGIWKQQHFDEQVDAGDAMGTQMGQAKEMLDLRAFSKRSRKSRKPERTKSRNTAEIVSCARTASLEFLRVFVLSGFRDSFPAGVGLRRDLVASVSEISEGDQVASFPTPYPARMAAKRASGEPPLVR